MADITAVEQMHELNTRSKPSLSDVMVLIAMGVVTFAFGTALYLQVGLTLWLTFIAALSLYLALLTLHALVRRAEAVDTLNGEIRRLEAELARLSTKPSARADSQQPTQFGSRTPERKRTGAGKETPTSGPRAPEPRQPLPGHSAEPAAQPSLPSAGLSASSTTPLPPPLPAVEPPPIPGTPTPWSFRPAQPVLEDRGAAATAPTIPFQIDPALDRIAVSIGGSLQQPIEQQATGSPNTSAIRDADVEMVQGLIKKLADEVNSASAPANAIKPQLAEPQGLTEQGLTEAAIESSLEALRATADTMRDTPHVQREPQETATRFAPPPVPTQRSHISHGPALSDIAPWPAPISSSRAAQARINALTEAVSARRVDVLLEPILGLEDQRPHHYDVQLRLKSSSGTPLETESLLDDLRDTGLLPMLDCTRISRVANVARRLADRGKANAVFSEFSSQSLSDDQFLNDFANAYHENDAVAAQLVLTFTQNEVRALAAREWATLDDMRELGFRFALQSITDLDMDFETLKRHGFDFIKLDANVFLEGLPATGGFVPAQDICRHFARMGLTLIVGKIDDESKLARIFGFGVLFGQGQLFGGPRLLKSEASTPHRPQGPSSHAAA